MRRAVLRGMLAGLLLFAAMITPATSTPVTAEQARTELSPGIGMYPRLIRLEHSGPANGRILATVTSFGPRGGFSPIFESTDEGRSFRQVGRVADGEGERGQCCSTLYELPRQVGALPAGTLLWAASFGQDAGPGRRVAIKVWYSTTLGRTWRFLSEVARARNHDGVWEPEFSVDAYGNLVCHYADETEAPVYWGPKRHTLAVPPHPLRPGMPVVRRLPDGRYYMSYEICNLSAHICGSYFRISPDGANWGDPADHGTRVHTPTGRYFQHAQTITLAPGGPTGTRILTVGQIYSEANGGPAPGNGGMILANDHLGAGPWYEVPAPVVVPNPQNHPCPNYSSTLLPTDGGRSILQIAADFAPDGQCRAYFGKGPA